MLDTAAAAYRTRADVDGEIACLRQLIQVLWGEPDPAQLQAVLSRCQTLAATGDPHAVALSHLARAHTALGQGGPRQAITELDQIPSEINDLGLHVLIAWFRVGMLLLRGQPEQALPLAETALTHAPITQSWSVRAGYVE